MAQITEWHDVPTTDSAPSDSLFDFAGILWRRKWVALVVLVACGALGWLYYLRAERVYESAAQILLIKKEKIPVAGSEGLRGSGRYSDYGYEDTLSTHMLLVTSPLIVGRAVESHNLAALPSLRPETAAIDDSDRKRWVTEQIVSKLKARRAGDRNAPDPNVMNLSFEGADPDDCAAVLNAVIDSYQKFLGETYQNFSEETVQLITQAKDVLSKQLAEKEEAYRKFRQSSPLIWQGKGQEAVNLHETRAAEIEKARSALVVELARTRSLMEGVQSALKLGANREAITLLLRNAQRDVQGQRPELNPRDQFEMKLLEAMLNEQEMLEAYGPDHPKVKTARKKIAMLREQFGATALPENAGGVDFLKVYLDSLNEELKVGQQRLADLDKLFDEERKASKELLAFQYQDETIRADLNRTQQIFDAVIKRLQEINLVKDYGGISMQLLSQPEHGKMVRPSLIVVAVLTFLVGGGLGLGMAYLVELADRSFRSPEDVKAQLGLPVLAHIPVIPTRRDKLAASVTGDGQSQPALHPLLCTFHHPKGRSAEAYRAVRTALYFGTGGENHKVIQVTSPGPGDGKTTLAANLAIAIAGSGKRVLLVDADFRRPRIGKFFGLEDGAGLTNLFSGEVDLPDLVHGTPVENLWVIPSGPRIRNPADLLTSSQFKEFVDLVRDQYDFVLLDSPPVLAVTDPTAIAPRVDGILFVLRLSKHARDSAMRAVEAIHTVGGRILGLVVNGVGAGRGYGYGKYGYRGYGYRGYGYRGYSYRAYGYRGYEYGPYGYAYGYHEGAETGTNGDDSQEKSAGARRKTASSNSSQPDSEKGRSKVP